MIATRSTKVLEKAHRHVHTLTHCVSIIKRRGTMVYLNEAHRLLNKCTCAPGGGGGGQALYRLKSQGGGGGGGGQAPSSHPLAPPLVMLT